MRLTLALCILAMFLPGCLVEVLTTTAIQGELAAENAAAGAKAMEKARETADGISARHEAAMPGATTPTITQADRVAMQDIRNAINRYGQAVGYYPPSLDALVQYGYMTLVPRTTSGQAFLFEPSTGVLQHPAEAAGGFQTPATASRRGGATAGGTGLMGETMTGIGIQQELNNMNTSASSNAGSAARSSSQNVQQHYGDRQMKALKDLNLDQ